MKSSKEEKVLKDIENLPRPLSILELCGFLLFSILVLYTRMPERFRGFLWAEDGPVFIQQAYEMGWQSIFYPYAGYLHLLPRLIAWIYSCIGNPKSIPLVFVWMTIIFSSFAMTYIGNVASRYLPRLSAVAIAIIPLTVVNLGEVWLTITNLQWVLTPLLAVLLWEMIYENGKKAFFESIAILVLMITGPFGLLLGGFAIVVMLFRRIKNNTAPNKCLFYSFLGGFLVQGSAILLCPKHLNGTTNWNLSTVDWTQTVGSFMLTDFMGITDIDFDSSSSQMFFSLTLIAALLFFAMTAKKPWKSLSLVLISIASLFLVLGMIRLNPLTLALRSRYTYLPTIFASWGLIISMACARKRWIQTIALLLIGSIFLNNALALRCVKFRRVKMKNVSDEKYFARIPPDEGWNITLDTHPIQHDSLHLDQK